MGEQQVQFSRMERDLQESKGNNKLRKSWLFSAQDWSLASNWWDTVEQAIAEVVWCIYDTDTCGI